MWDVCSKTFGNTETLHDLKPEMFPETVALTMTHQLYDGVWDFKWSLSLGVWYRVG